MRRLRSKESSLDAENQILKSKLMHSDNTYDGSSFVKADDTSKYASNIPKLAAPGTGNGTSQNNSSEFQNYFDNSQANTGYENNNYDNSYNYDNNNYNQGYDYNNGGDYSQQHNSQPVGADEQAINDIDQFLDEDDF